MRYRKEIALEMKSSLKPMVPLVLHWDVKIMDDFTALATPGKEHVDCLPSFVAGDDIIKLLSVPKLYSGTDECMTYATINTVNEWGLQDHIKGICFDTTASNTGVKVEFVVSLNHIYNTTC